MMRPRSPTWRAMPMWRLRQKAESLWSLIRIFAHGWNASKRCQHSRPCRGRLSSRDGYKNGDAKRDGFRFRALRMTSGPALALTWSWPPLAGYASHPGMLRPLLVLQVHQDLPKGCKGLFSLFDVAADGLGSGGMAFNRQSGRLPASFGAPYQAAPTARPQSA
jgi:hypothetical protein